MSTLRERYTTASLAQRVVNVAWPYVSGKRGLIVLAIAMAVAGLTWNWSWLVAAGVAPFLLAALPCAAMCALGLCMNRGGGKSCSPGAKSPEEKANVKGGPEGDK